MLTLINDSASQPFKDVNLPVEDRVRDLISRMVVAFVNGFQGDNPKYLKAVATVKHFVANNSEYNRHTGYADDNKAFHHVAYRQRGDPRGSTDYIEAAYV